jgi:hypothetical protein
LQSPAKKEAQHIPSFEITPLIAYAGFSMEDLTWSAVLNVESH